MLFVAMQYWPFVMVAFAAGIAIGWWGQVAAAQRERAGPDEGEAG